EKALAHKLMRGGFDNVLGVVNDISSEHLKSIKYIKAEDLTKAVQRRGIQAWDIRTAKEYAEGHSAGIANLPLLEIKDKASKLDKHQPILIHCQSGARAAIVIHFLKVWVLQTLLFMMEVSMNGKSWGINWLANSSVILII